MNTNKLLVSLFRISLAFFMIPPFSLRSFNRIQAAPTVGGITVTPAAEMVTSENLGQATFTVVLDIAPAVSNTVVVGLSSSNLDEGTVSPDSLTFDSNNWSSQQTVTVTGVDDDIDDGDVVYTIITTVTSNDPDYTGVDAIDVPMTNQDNDTAGISVTPVTPLVTTEALTTATFTIQLNSEPTNNVTVSLESSDTTEGNVSPASLLFTPANWNSAQTVTVTGVDDAEVDGNQPYTILTGAAVSGDSKYGGMDPANVTLTNQDDDVAGFTVTPTSGLTTSEASGTATFSVKLNSQPTANVTISLSSSDTTEGTVSPTSLEFTAGNWDTAQTVTVTGVNDDIDDDHQAYTIVTGAAVSSDGNYSGKNPSDVSVTNTDDDTAGFTVTPTSGLNTSEPNGTTTFSVKLNSQPADTVTISLNSSDTAEGTVSPASLQFTTANWNTPQTVTVIGVDDTAVDGNQAYTIVTEAAVSSDGNYSGKNPSDVSVINTDNDTAGFTVTPESGLITSEANGTATFTVKLTGQPAENVTISLSSDDTTEGTVSPTSLQFTTANWNTPQTVTVTGVDDAVVDGNQVYTIVTGAAVSGDGNYSGKNPSDVSVTNTDDDTAGFTVTPTFGLTTSEPNGTTTFSVKLISQPTANVTISLSSNDTTEGTVSPTSVQFTTANWDTAQTVTVTGVNDDIDDDNQAYTIVTGAAVSGDGNYAGKNPSDVSVTNTDDDTAGISVTPTSGLITSEANGSATFSIGLNSQPTANVTISLSSSDITEGTVSPASVQFTAANWNTPQTVTVTGVDDAVVDGDQPYTIVTGAAVSGDTKYSGIDPANVSVTNLDGDLAGIVVNPISGLTTTEAGGPATFSIKLMSQPTENVTISLSSNDTTEGTVSPTSVQFTSANWNTAQTVTVTGANDHVDDDDQPYTIVTGAAVSGDGNYSGKNPDDVSVTNQDDDTAGITVTPTSGLVTTEAHTTANFAIKLNSEPTSEVTIGLSSSNDSEGTVLPESITFNINNWNLPQTLTVTGADDFVADGNIQYTILTAAAISLDNKYKDMDAANVTVTNNDNETPDFSINPLSGLLTSEKGVTAAFTVTLNSQPTANVTFSLTSSNPAEGTVSPSTMTFNAVNWNTAQTATITGVNDFVDDDNIAYTILTGAATSTDPIYNGRNPPDVSVTNQDDDTAEVFVNPKTGLLTSETGITTTFTVTLASQPVDNVIINLASNSPAEGTVTPSAMNFTSTNWNKAQTATVKGVDDQLADGPVPYTITLTANTSLDLKYKAINPPNVGVINIDNEIPSVTVNPTTGLETTEAGGIVTFTVSLSKQPNKDVTIGLSSSDLTEGTISTASLKFTKVNWETPQVVTVTGVNDVQDDGNQSYTIVTAPILNTGTPYDNVNPADVSVINRNDDFTPVAEKDTYTMKVSSGNVLAVGAPGVLGNDRDENPGDQLKAVLDQPPEKGTLTFMEDGSFIYEPVPDEYEGVVSFTYKVKDPTNLISAAVTTTIIVDLKVPVVHWVEPVKNSEVRVVIADQEPQIPLKVNVDENVAVDRVYIVRWDSLQGRYVEIGTDSTAPYEMTLDTISLNSGWNQVFATAYDTVGNVSQRQHIWVFRPRKLFLPMILRK